MFLDASAVFAILNREPGFEAVLKLVNRSQSTILTSPLSRFEAIVSLARNRAGPNRSAKNAEIEAVKVAVDLFQTEIGAEEMPITDSIGAGALEAAQSWGRAVGHPAGLNLGDCFAYACAKERRVGLLYRGGDFALTDPA